MKRWKSQMAAAATIALLVASCSSRDDADKPTTTVSDGKSPSTAIDYHLDDCVSDPTVPVEGDTLTIASSYPQSGLPAAFVEIARGWEAYFDKANADGGVDFAGKKFKVEVVDKDDAYNPQKTASNIEELVGQEGDKAFAAFSVVGTANNVQVRDFLDELCVPNVFAATGAVAWGNTKYPWLLGSTLVPYSLESQAFADYLKKNKPEAKVAILRQADEFGDTYEQSFRKAIEGTKITVTKVESYPAGSESVAAQVTSLASSGADTFFNGATLLACPYALKAKAAEGWDPVTWVSGTCVSKTLMGIAGADGADVLSLGNLKDPLKPEFHDDPALIEMRDAVQEHQPKFNERHFEVKNGVVQNAIVAYGWAQAELFAKALEAAKEPTRLAAMESIRNLDKVTSSLGLDGITFSTGPDDPFLGESYVLQQYDAAAGHFVALPGVVDLEGKTASVTPKELITK